MRVAIVLLLIASNVQADGLSFGIAEEDVTPKLDPKVPVYMAGFGHNRKAAKVHDPIMARAVVLSDGSRKIAMVSVDVVGLFNAVAQSVRKQVEGFAYVCVSSTHNHEGPDTLGLWGSSPFTSGVNKAYMKDLEAGIVRAIKAADANSKPAQASIAIAPLPDLLHDAREPYVKHSELVAIRFVGKDNKPLGVVLQWNSHPETMGSSNTEVTADFVATTVADVRKAQGCPVAYFTGTVGGLMTSLHVPIKDAAGKEWKDGTWEKTEIYGRKVAEGANDALKSAKAVTLTPFDLRRTEVLVPVENELYKLGWRVGVLERQFYLRERDAEGKPVPTRELSNPGAVLTELGYLRLGELAVAVIPGEIYPELVLNKVQDPVDLGADFPTAPIEPAIYDQMQGKYKMIIGLGNDEIGYIIPKRQWDAKAPYCYKRKKDQYGEENSIGPDAAPVLCKAFAELAQPKK